MLILHKLINFAELSDKQNDKYFSFIIFPLRAEKISYKSFPEVIILIKNSLSINKFKRIFAFFSFKVLSIRTITSKSMIFKCSNADLLFNFLVNFYDSARAELVKLATIMYIHPSSCELQFLIDIIMLDNTYIEN